MTGRPPDMQAAIDVVGDYLAALEAREVDRAQARLHEGARIIGPGGSPAASVAGIVANSSRRYQWVGKHIERYDAMPADDGGVIVYCMGTLHGRWPDGTAFDGIRFIDRFELREGRILSQQVWNDAAEHRLRRAAAAAGTA